MRPDEAMELLCTHDREDLYRQADRVRTHFFKNTIETCCIVNAKSGRCPENCKWCAQSAWHKTSAEVYPLMELEETVGYALRSRDAGIQKFSIVTSGRFLSEAEVDAVAAIYERLRSEGGLGLCGSLGLLSRSQLFRLKEAGMTRYHCNLETAPSKFPDLCTTHTVEEKLRTIGWAREAGLEICSGGIIGMGETREQRVEFAFALKDAGASSIPVNILNPIPGTPLGDSPPLAPDEILGTFAIMRLVNPGAHIRFAGGRSLIAGLQEKALKCGVSAAILGDMLTTSGPSVQNDFEMFSRLGYEY